MLSSLVPRLTFVAPLPRRGPRARDGTQEQCRHDECADDRGEPTHFTPPRVRRGMLPVRALLGNPSKQPQRGWLSLALTGARRKVGTPREDHALSHRPALTSATLDRPPASARRTIAAVHSDEGAAPRCDALASRRGELASRTQVKSRASRDGQRSVRPLRPRAR